LTPAIEASSFSQLGIVQFLLTALDGKNYNVAYYNLDMIISLGYRIKSIIATQFRRYCRFLFPYDHFTFPIKDFYFVPFKFYSFHNHIIIIK